MTRLTAADVQLLINCVDKVRGIVDLKFIAADGSEHRIGHLPSEGWFCLCERGKHCELIEQVKRLVPPMETR